MLHLREQLEALEAESARDRFQLTASVPGRGTLSALIALHATYPVPHQRQLRDPHYAEHTGLLAEIARRAMDVTEAVVEPVFQARRDVCGVRRLEAERSSVLLRLRC